MDKVSFPENSKQEKADNIEAFVKANLHYLPKEKQSKFYNIINPCENAYEKEHNNKSYNTGLDHYPIGVLKEALNILKAKKSQF